MAATVPWTAAGGAWSTDYAKRLSTCRACPVRLVANCLKKPLEGLDLALLADAQPPPTDVRLIHGGEVVLADWPAVSSTPSAVTPFGLIRVRSQATAIPAAQCTVSQEVSKKRAVSCHETRLANWLGTDRKPLSSAACRRPAGGSRP